MQPPTITSIIALPFLALLASGRVFERQSLSSAAAYTGTVANANATTTMITTTQPSVTSSSPYSSFSSASSSAPQTPQQQCDAVHGKFMCMGGGLYCQYCPACQVPPTGREGYALIYFGPNTTYCATSR